MTDTTRHATVPTLENRSAGVNSDTLMTLSLRCVALSVTPEAARMYPARHSRKTSVIDCRSV